MSPKLKRDANEAFGQNSTDSTPRPSKSKRRKERHSQHPAATTPSEQQKQKSQIPSHVSATNLESIKKSPTQDGTPATKARDNRTSKNTSSSSHGNTSNGPQKDQLKSKEKRQKGDKQQKHLVANGDSVAASKKVVADSKEPTTPSKAKQLSSEEKLAIEKAGQTRERKSQKSRQKEEKQKRKEKAGDEQVGPSAIGKTLTKKQRKQKGQKEGNTSKWLLSSPTGGRFIDHDPILTLDEQFLILATTKDIQIYATQTSLLVRTIPARSNSSIVTYSQLPNDAQHLVVGFEDGTIKKFDWTSGERIWTKRLDNHIISVTPTSTSDQGDSFLVVVELEGKQTAITSLTVDFNGEQTGLRPMLSKSTLTGRVCFSAELGIAVVCTQNLILIGRLEGEGTEASLQWEEVSVADRIICFDARISAASKKETKSKRSSGLPVVTVAAGLKSGEIHIYNDLLSRRQEKNILNPQRLHWHRVAPRAVKFSPDSRYLISGGDETVLVMWQLDTNQKQVLPHLTSAILNATISVQGSAYALRLADNSIMVLSTSDLKPTANVSGLAIDMMSAPFLPGSAIPAALHPQQSDQMLLAYSSQALTPGLKPSEKSLNMLQTYDTSSGLQLSRQALARNLASTINIGGNGQIIHEPDVTHLDVSHDGQWLITVDQWSPNADDLDQIYLSRGDNLSRGLHTESFLRFWSTTIKGSENASNVPWELNTRIDQPATQDQSSSSSQPAVLAVATSPTRHQVAVADTANTLKIYTPKARVKGGLPVKDNNGQQLFSWTCDHDLSLRGPSETSDPRSATLAFSNDGSVIAASWATTSDARARVHLVEPKSGTNLASLPDVVSAGHAHLSFCGQNLVALSSKLVIFDMVMAQSTLVFNISNDFPTNRFDSAKSRLAVNTRSGIAAVALSERDVRKASHVLLYDVRPGVEVSPNGAIQAIYKERISETAQVLLAEHESGGFLIVDGEARSVKLSPPGSGAVLDAVGLKSSTNVDDTVKIGKLENTFGSGRKAETDKGVTPRRTDTSTERGSLEDLFRFERSSDVPGPMELFGRVIDVVGGVGA